MGDGEEKSKLQEALGKYKSEVMKDNSQHKHKSCMDMAEEYGCGKRLTIPIDGKDHSFPHFSCILGKCDKCSEKD